jgi:methionyl aminopeptidase
VVCHGIASPKTILKEGDIVNVDSTTILDGYYADASRMYMVGEVSPGAKRLVEVARECMELGIEAAKPWHWLGDIGAACGAHAHKNGYSVVTDLGGHGVGKDFHMEPFVPHVGEVGTGMLLVPGMVLTVEPMINEGTYKVTVDKKDGWTVRTKDRKLSAQWEKTILITETGTEVLSS